MHKRGSVQAIRRIGERLPLRWRLALVFFGLLVLLLGTLGIFVSFAAEQALLANQAVALRDEARLVTGTANGHAPTLPFPPKMPQRSGPFPGNNGNNGDNGDNNARLASLLHLLSSTSTDAAILQPNGTVVEGSTTLGSIAPPVVSLNTTQVQQGSSTTQQDGTYTLGTDSLGERQLIVLVPLVENSHTVALLQIGTLTAPIDRSVMEIRLLLFLGIIGIIGIAAALMLPLVGAVLRPLMVMERTSRRIAEGELSLRLDVPPTHDEIGRLAGSFNRMVARLEAAFTRQKQFVSDVSHELRTPLTVFSGSLEMLLLGVDQGNREDARRLMRSMYADVERMQRLVADLLALTRIDEGRLVLRQDTLDVGALLTKVCEQAEQLARGQTIQCTIADSLPTIHGDADRLQQVLLNVLDNAIKFTAPEGRIELIAHSEHPTSVTIAVRDTGAGVPTQALPYVFDRFYRADPSRTREGQQSGGNGLGLAIARELVLAHGGEITMSSKQGEGTTVTIRLNTGIK